MKNTSRMVNFKGLKKKQGHKKGLDKFSKSGNFLPQTRRLFMIHAVRTVNFIDSKRKQNV